MLARCHGGLGEWKVAWVVAPSRFACLPAWVFGEVCRKESTLQQEGQREPSVVVVVVVCCLVETVVGAAQLAKDYGGLRRPECVQKSPSDQKRKSFVRKAQSGVESISSWSYDMEGHAKKCVERNCELANKTTQQVYKVATPRIDDHQFKEEEMGSLGELSQLCLQIVLKCLYLARIGRSDVLWSVKKLARVITKWTRACDKRLARFISYIHHASEYRQHCYVGNTAKQCRLGLFQDSDFAGDLEDSKSTSGGILCIFGCHTFVQTSWMCNKQTSVSHSSTEAEVISLDAGVRMDGIPALTLWDLVIEVFHSAPNRTDGPKREPWGNRRSCCQTCITPSQSSTPTSFQNAFWFQCYVVCL